MYSAVFVDKVDMLRCLGDWLKFLSAHDALILLRNCYALPKLMYVLRTAPCFESSTMESYRTCSKNSPTLNFVRRRSFVQVDSNYDEFPISLNPVIRLQCSSGEKFCLIVLSCFMNMKDMCENLQ